MVKISFLGDISLNNIYEHYATNNENPFLEVKPILENSDIVIGNLECMMRGDEGENEKKIPRLSTSEKALNLLSELNLKIVTISHNHVYDNLLSGFNKTCDKLDKLNIEYTGAKSAIKGNKDIIYKYIGNQTFSFIAYLTLDTNPKLPSDCELDLNIFNLDTLIKDIEIAKSKSNFITILLHWGGRSENGFYPDWYQPILGKKLIDYGANLVIGGHSHTFQPFEKYKNGYIFYSLGNFCFDNVITNNKVFPIGKYRKRESCIVEINVDNSNIVSTNMIPIYNKNGYIHIAKSKALRKIKCRNFNFKVIFSNKLFWKIYFTIFRKFGRFYFYLFETEGSIMSKLNRFGFKKILRQLKR